MSESNALQIDEQIQRLTRQAQELRKQIRSVPAAITEPGDGDEVPASPDKPSEAQEVATSPKNEGRRAVAQAGKKGPKPLPATRPVSRPAAIGPRQAPGGDSRLANYMSIQGFTPQRTTSQNRSVQKNKAIVMLTLVAIVAYVLYKVMF